MLRVTLSRGSSMGRPPTTVNLAVGGARGEGFRLFRDASAFKWGCDHNRDHADICEIGPDGAFPHPHSIYVERSILG